MPHKRNPIVSEQITGLARVLRSNAMAAMENVALWHERDISHSSVERIIFRIPQYSPTICSNTDHGSDRTACCLSGPHEGKPELTHGLVFSGQLLLDLVEAGVLREDAYRLVQTNAMKAWKEELNFRELILNDTEITSKVKRETLEHCFRFAASAAQCGQDISKSVRGGERRGLRGYEYQQQAHN